MKKTLKTILVSSILCHIILCNNMQAFNSLTEIQNYAKAYPEQVKSDNNDWVDPEFGTFLKKKFRKTWFTRLLTKLRLTKKPVWDPYKFKKLIKKITKYRKDNNYKSPFNKTIKLKKGDKLVVFGDLQGAFHSMNRNLQELKNNLGLINDDLTLTSKNTYFLFIGDAISRSPYSLELLSIILSLMDKNPQQVIYLQGNHEKNKYWQNFSMERELKVKAANLVTNIITQVPLEKEINNFFSTLPKYLIAKHKDEKIICAHSKVKNKMSLDQNLKFIILGEKRKEVLKETKGLEFLGYQNGVAKWSILSAQTPIYQKFFKFYNDTFIEVSIGDSMEKSILTLYHHNVKSNKKYHKIYYDPTFGLELPNKKPIIGEKNIIKVGSSMYLTGVNWDLGKEIRKGMEMALHKFNMQQLKYLIKPYIFDDEYNQRIALGNVKRLYNTYNIDTLLMPTGTPTLSAYQDMIQSGKIIAFFPTSGSRRFRKEDTKNIIQFRPTYAKEATKMIRFLIKEYGIKRFAFFYQTYGESIIKVLKEELKKHGITEWLDLPHMTTQEDFKAQAKKVKEFVPDAIGCFSSQYPTQKFIRTIGAGFFLKHLLFMPPSLYTRNFKGFLENKGIKYVISSIVPEPHISNLELAKEHSKMMAERELQPTIHSFEGYLATSLFTDAVSKVKPPVTKEKLMKHLQSLKDYNFKGIRVSYDPQTKNLIHDIWIKKLDNTWVKY